MVKTAVGATIMLTSGSYFDYEDPRGSPFTIEDVAIALGKICRFNGHCNGFYSVAEHSVYVSKIVPKPDALAGLLHDASEAFLGDMPGPLKWISPEFRRFEATIEEAVLERFGIEGGLPKSVKIADMIMLATEKNQIMPNPDDEWPMLKDIRPSSIAIQRLSPEEASTAFLDRYSQLISL